MAMIMRQILFGLICGSFLTFSAVSIGLGDDVNVSTKKQLAKSKTAAPKAGTVKAVPSDEIKSLQRALNKAGFKLKVDGLMGKKTRTAIKKFQKQKGLKVTGKADKLTQAKLGMK